MILKPEHRYKETRIGSGLFKDVVTGSMIRAPDMKSLKRRVQNPNMKGMGVSIVRRGDSDRTTETLNKIKHVLEKPTTHDKFDDSLSQAVGNMSLSSKAKQNVSNITDENGLYRPGTTAMLSDPAIVRDLVKPPKKGKGAEFNLSDMLGKKAMKKHSVKKGSGGRLHGTGGRLHGTGIAYI